MASIFPDHRLKPLHRRGFVREHLEQIGQGEAFTVGLARCFACHFSPPPNTLEYRDSDEKCQVGIIRPKLINDCVAINLGRPAGCGVGHAAPARSM